MKHIQFFRNLGQLRFSGQVVFTHPNGQQWVVYLSQGAIVYATGGAHPVRRWRRNLMAFCPMFPTYRLAWQIDLAKVDAEMLSLGWEYSLLNFWLTEQRITQQQIGQILRSAVTEVLFDIVQTADITAQIKSNSAVKTKIEPITIDAAIEQAQALRQAWQDAGLAAYSPDWAPAVKQAEELQKQSSTQVYQTLIKRLNGQNTLRDLAVEMRRDVVQLTTSLHLCIQLNWIEFAVVADLPAPIYRRSVARPAPEPAPAQGKLIACVDDSPFVRQTMEELLTSAGYQCLGIGDGVRAIGILLARKPDFIFLDLMMPNANGYEICEQLRKLSHFRQTPIVILTGNDGFANRLRSNFVGASDFLGKPLNAEAVLSVIRKHLVPQAPSLSAAES